MAMMATSGGIGQSVFQNPTVIKIKILLQLVFVAMVFMVRVFLCA